MFIPAQAHILMVPTNLIDDNGNLKVEVMNLKYDVKGKIFFQDLSHLTGTKIILKFYIALVALKETISVA